MATILLIEDDVAVQATVRLMLEDDGHVVHLLPNGVRAVAECLAVDPDLVITDILMPEKEGIETIRDLKAARPDLNVVAISGGGRLGRHDCLAMARTCGASQTLAKPFDDEELRAVLTKVLG